MQPGVDVRHFIVGSDFETVIRLRQESSIARDIFVAFDLTLFITHNKGLALIEKN